MTRSAKEQLLTYLEQIELYYDWQEPLDITWRVFGDDEYLANVHVPILFGFMLDYIVPYLNSHGLVWYIGASDGRVLFSIQ